MKRLSSVCHHCNCIYAIFLSTHVGGNSVGFESTHELSHFYFDPSQWLTLVDPRIHSPLDFYFRKEFAHQSTSLWFQMSQQGFSFKESHVWNLNNLGSNCTFKFILQEFVGEFRQALRLSHENENYFEKFVAFLKSPTKSPSIWFFNGFEQYSWNIYFLVNSCRVF